VAAKIATEERYHLRHTSLWLRRLGLGTAESHARLQAALDVLWPYARQLFVPLPGDAALVAADIIPDAATLRREWDGLTRPFLVECGLAIPDDALPRRDIPRTEHTEHLVTLLLPRCSRWRDSTRRRSGEIDDELRDGAEAPDDEPFVVERFSAAPWNGAEAA
jgi:phenylacetate-CoA oxygenase PaaI subunit